MSAKKIIISLIYGALFYFFLQDWVQFLLFLAGVLLGLGLMVLDQKILHRYYLEENEMGANQEQLITRSALFNLILIPLALYVITSTRSSIGSGLVLGMLLIILEEMMEYRRPVNLFERRFLADTNFKVDKSQVNQIIAVMISVFLVLNLLFIIN